MLGVKFLLGVHVSNLLNPTITSIVKAPSILILAFKEIKKKKDHHSSEHIVH